MLRYICSKHFKTINLHSSRKYKTYFGILYYITCWQRCTFSNFMGDKLRPKVPTLQLLGFPFEFICYIAFRRKNYHWLTNYIQNFVVLWFSGELVKTSPEILFITEPVKEWLHTKCQLPICCVRVRKICSVFECTVYIRATWHARGGSAPGSITAFTVVFQQSA